MRRHIVADQLTLQIPRDLRNLVVGKGILLTAFSIFCGYFYHRDVIADNAKAVSLTLLAYTNNYENYKASLIQAEWPFWGHLLLVLVMVFVFFAAYEMLGWGLGQLVARLR